MCVFPLSVSLLIRLRIAAIVEVVWFCFGGQFLRVTSQNQTLEDGEGAQEKDGVEECEEEEEENKEENVLDLITHLQQFKTA